MIRNALSRQREYDQPVSSTLIPLEYNRQDENKCCIGPDCFWGFWKCHCIQELHMMCWFCHKHTPPRHHRHDDMSSLKLLTLLTTLASMSGATSEWIVSFVVMRCKRETPDTREHKFRQRRDYFRHNVRKLYTWYMPLRLLGVSPTPLSCAWTRA